MVSKKLERPSTAAERPTFRQENDVTRDESRVYLNSPMLEEQAKNQHNEGDQ